MVNAKAPSHQAYGDTIFARYRSLCIDDFGIKYIGREHVEHLLGILKEHYKCSQDWSGANEY